SPPSYLAYDVHSSHANAPGRRGVPFAATLASTPCHLSVIARAKRVEVSLWSSARIFTENASTASHAEKAFALRAMLKRISGGSNDTELKELTVAPRSE